MKTKPLVATGRIDIYAAATETEKRLPFVENGISAGFPSPADDFLDASIDLNKELIRNPLATFYGKVRGVSMQDMGLNDGDLLIIDKSLSPQNGKIAVCYIDGEFTVKRIQMDKDCLWLMPANPDYKPIKVTEENDFVVWGIVVHVIKNV